MTSEAETKQKIGIAISMLHEMDTSEYIGVAIKHGEAALEALNRGDIDLSGAHLLKMNLAVKKARAEIRRAKA